MKCPFCHEGKFEVIDSRHSNEFPIRRRRACDHCKRRVWTIESIEEVPLNVVKKSDRRREPFDAAKLRRGLEKACYKRPVSPEQINAIVGRIEDEIRAQYYGEVPAPVIGDLAMDFLQKIDQIAYVRFASVYREFQDVSDFVQAAIGQRSAAKKPRRPRDKETAEDEETRRQGDKETRRKRHKERQPTG